MGTAAPNFGYPIETIAVFAVLIIGAIFVDIFAHRRNADITLRNAATWSVIWIVLAVGFQQWIQIRHGSDWAHAFLTGYLIEKTLSVDNLMVFVVIFEYFEIQSGLQRKILYYGILGALIFRAIFVVIGSGVLLRVGPWAEIAFGLMVALAAVKMARSGRDDSGEHTQMRYEDMPLVRVFRRVYPVFPHLAGNAFFLTRDEAITFTKHNPTVQIDQKVARWITPAFVCLLAVEGSDLLFAFDSVPAVIAITKEPFLVYSAMIFGVLGLRSLYFLLLSLNRYLVHLEKAIILILLFICTKMISGAVAHLTGGHSAFVVTPTMNLVVVFSLLAAGVLASFVWPEEKADSNPTRDDVGSDRSGLRNIRFEQSDTKTHDPASRSSHSSTQL